MPPFASSNSPDLSVSALVNAPRLNPKSSLSMRSSGKCAAIDGDEASCRASAVLVDGVGHEFFAAARFSGDEHGPCDSSGRFDAFAQLLHDFAFSNHVTYSREPAEIGHMNIDPLEIRHAGSHRHSTDRTAAAR